MEEDFITLYGDDFQGEELPLYTNTLTQEIGEDISQTPGLYKVSEISNVTATPYIPAEIPEFQDFKGFDIQGFSLPKRVKEENLTFGEKVLRDLESNRTQLDRMAEPVYSATPDQVERYQDPTLPYNPNYDMEEIYAKAHPFSYGDAFSKMFETTKINLASNFKNIASAFSTGDINKIYDNEHLEELSLAMENLELDMPQYFTQEERDNPLTTGLNSTIKSFIPAAGTSIAALPDMLIGHAAMGLVGTLGGGVAGLAGSQALALTRDTKILGNAFKSMYNYSKNLTKAKNALVASKGYRGAGILVSGVLYSNGEAGLQARMNADDYIKQQREEYWNKYKTFQGFDENSINETANKIAQSTYIANTALIGASQYLQLPTLLRGKATTQLTKNNIPGFKKIDGLTTAVGKKKREYLWEFGKDAITEGLEESNQAIIDDATTEYFSGKTYKDNVIDSIQLAISNRLNKEGLIEFLGGAFIGGGMSGSGQLARGISSKVYNNSPYTKERINQFNSSSNNLISSVNNIAYNEEQFIKSISEGNLIEANNYLNDSIFSLAEEAYKNNTTEARKEYFNDLKVMDNSSFNALMKTNLDEQQQVLLVDNLINDFNEGLAVQQFVNNIASINPFVNQNWFMSKLNRISKDEKEKNIIAGKVWQDYKNILGKSLYRKNSLSKQINTLRSELLASNFNSIEKIFNPNLNQAVIDFKQDLINLKKLNIENPNSQQKKDLALLEKLNQDDLSVQNKYNLIVNHLEISDIDKDKLDNLLKTQAVYKTFDNTTDLENISYQKQQIENILDYNELILKKGNSVEVNTSILDSDLGDIEIEATIDDNARIEDILNIDKDATEKDLLTKYNIDKIDLGSEVWFYASDNSVFKTLEEAVEHTKNNIGINNRSSSTTSTGEEITINLGNTDKEKITVTLPGDEDNKGSKNSGGIKIDINKLNKVKNKTKSKKKQTSKDKLNNLRIDKTVERTKKGYKVSSTGKELERITKFINNKNTDLLDLFNKIEDNFIVNNTDVTLKEDSKLNNEIDKLLIKGYKSPKKFQDINIPKVVLNKISEDNFFNELEIKRKVNIDNYSITLNTNDKINILNNSKKGNDRYLFSKPLNKDEFGVVLDDIIKRNSSLEVNLETSSNINSSRNAIKKELINLKTSTVIGTEIDNIIRDYFSKGRLLVESTKYKPIMSKSEFKTFLDNLDELKSFFDGRGEKVYTDEFILYDIKQDLAGTPDIITLDKDGDFRLYDIKTMVAKQKGSDPLQYWNGSTKSSTEFTSKRSRYSDQLSSYSILANNTHNIVFKEIGVIAIGVNYKPGEAVSTLQPNFIKPNSTSFYISNNPKISSKTIKSGVNKGEETLALIYKRKKVKGKDGKILTLDNKKTIKKIKSSKKTSKKLKEVEEEIARVKNGKSSVLSIKLNNTTSNIEEASKKILDEKKKNLNSEEFKKEKERLEKLKNQALEEAINKDIKEYNNRLQEEKESEEKELQESLDEFKEENDIVEEVRSRFNLDSNNINQIDLYYDTLSKEYVLFIGERDAVITNSSNINNIEESILYLDLEEQSTNEEITNNKTELESIPKEQKFIINRKNIKQRPVKIINLRNEVTASEVLIPQSKAEKNKSYRRLKEVNITPYINFNGVYNDKKSSSVYFSSREAFQVREILYYPDETFYDKKSKEEVEADNSEFKPKVYLRIRKIPKEVYDKYVNLGLTEDEIFTTESNYKSIKKKRRDEIESLLDGEDRVFPITKNKDGSTLSHTLNFVQDAFDDKTFSMYNNVERKKGIRVGDFFSKKGDGTKEVYIIKDIKNLGKDKDNPVYGIKLENWNTKNKDEDYIDLKTFNKTFIEFDFNKGFNRNGVDKLMQTTPGIKVNYTYKINNRKTVYPMKVYTMPEGFFLETGSSLRGGKSFIKTIAFSPGRDPIIEFAGKIQVNDGKDKKNRYYSFYELGERKGRLFNGSSVFLREKNDRTRNAFKNFSKSNLKITRLETLNPEMFKVKVEKDKYESRSKLDLKNKLKKLTFTDKEIELYFSRNKTLRKYLKENNLKEEPKSMIRNSLGKLFEIIC